MKQEQTQLETALVKAEAFTEAKEYESAYFILRRAVLEILGMTVQQLNEKVLEAEEKN